MKKFNKSILSTIVLSSLILTSNSVFADNNKLSLSKVTENNPIKSSPKVGVIDQLANITIATSSDTQEQQKGQAGFLNFKFNMSKYKRSWAVNRMFAINNCASFVRYLNETEILSDGSTNHFYNKLDESSAKLERNSDGEYKESHDDNQDTLYCIASLKNYNNYVKNASGFNMGVSYHGYTIQENNAEIKKVFNITKPKADEEKVSFQLSGVKGSSSKDGYGINVNVYDSSGVYQSTDAYKDVFDLHVSYFSKAHQDPSINIYNEFINTKSLGGTSYNIEGGDDLYWKIGGKSWRGEFPDDNLLENDDINHNTVEFNINNWFIGSYIPSTFYAAVNPKQDYAYKSMLNIDQDSNPNTFYFQ